MAILGEEYGHERPDARYTWVIDPIDGTKAFISGMTTWGTLIALQDRGQGIIGVLNQPFLGERFVGHGEGAYLDDRRLATRACPELSGAVLYATEPDMFAPSEWAALRFPRRPRPPAALRCRLLRLRDARCRLHRSGGRGEHESLGHRSSDSYCRGSRRPRDRVGTAGRSVLTAGCWRWAIPGCTNPRSRSLPPPRHSKASERLGTATVTSPMQADMHGKVCVVTGASSGIGRVTALGLAERGATVVLICRNEERGGPVLEEIERRGGSGNATLLTADLSSQRQVREVAAAFLERFDRLDVLINNAGIAGWGTRLVTEDGLETTIAVNHLAPFLLTSLLLDRLRASAPARVITVSSAAHRNFRARFRRPARRAALFRASVPTAARSSRTYSSPMSFRAGWREPASPQTACTPALSRRASSAICRAGCAWCLPAASC